MGENSEKQIELLITQRQREIIKETTGKDLNSLSLRAIDDKLQSDIIEEPTPHTRIGPFRLKLTEQQTKVIAEATGREYKDLLFELIGSEPFFSTPLPGQAFPICYPPPDIRKCQPDRPSMDAAMEVLLSDNSPLIARIVPYGLAMFRDAVLRGTALGDRVIDEYYKHIDEGASILKSHPDLLDEARELLLKNSALISAATATIRLPEILPLKLDFYIPPDNVREVIEFLEKASEYASPDLKAAIEDMKVELPQFSGKTTQAFLEILKSKPSDTVPLAD